MSKLKPSMRPKVKGDTFFLPESNGGVYFRNNVGSFRMEGRTIGQWIEKLIPVFNGKHSLEELTHGLPKEYQEQVFAIAESLYRNGFIQDVSEDHPSALSDHLLQLYASQIEFLSHSGGSGAYRFQCYRQSKAVVIGAGPFLVSLVSALLDSGLPKLHMVITDSTPTNRQRIRELEQHARKTDAEVAIEEMTLSERSPDTWRKIIQMFDSVLYVAKEGDLEELRTLHAICREENKIFLSAICWRQTGIAGPLVHPDAQGCWESAWRRIHRAALGKQPQGQGYSHTAGAMLANLIVFEWFKHITDVEEEAKESKVFLLDLETLEGNWHSFLPHPEADAPIEREWIANFEHDLEQDDQVQQRQEPAELISFFQRLTSEKTGIFHTWEEADLQQLPLSQCRVQVVDPRSEGPAELLAEMVCTGMTHKEARLEAGLAGLESYVTRMIEPGRKKLPEFVGVGAGDTLAEGICRGLQKCLSAEWLKRDQKQMPTVTRIQLNEIKDERCQFYLQALTTMQGAPVIGLGVEVLGFPVAWVGTSNGWHGSVGLNLTLALRQSLQWALHQAQDQNAFCTVQVLSKPTVLLDENVLSVAVIPVHSQETQMACLRSATQILRQNRMRLVLLDLALEPFIKEELSGIIGVSLREEET